MHRCGCRPPRAPLRQVRWLDLDPLSLGMKCVGSSD